jgi:hypothetical protein
MPSPPHDLLTTYFANQSAVRDLLQSLPLRIMYCTFELSYFFRPDVNHLTPDDLYRGRAVSLLKIKISSKNTCKREKPTNTSINHFFY